MKLLSGKSIKESLSSTDANSLFVDPLLDEGQVGEVTIDLRLGYDFLVSILTRKPYIDLLKNEPDHRSIKSYFQHTRREIGDKFILYPNQVVLTTTLEYVSLPSNVYADILSRSSYTRLGIMINTMVQPGFRGCVPIELTNNSNNAIELIVGSRLFQARLYEIHDGNEYLNTDSTRKYFVNVRPTVSQADDDPDLKKLISLSD